MNAYQWLLIIGLFGGLIISPIIAVVCICVAVFMFLGKL